MKLIYKIEYNSTSFYFKRLIDELIKNSNIDANTKQYFGFILIFIDDELENIEKFFLNLETNLPYSMFLKKSYLIDEFNEEIKELEDKNIKENFEILTNRKVKDILENILPNVRLVDSGEAIGRRVRDVIKESNSVCIHGKHNRAFYTGVLKNYEDRLKMVKSFGFENLEQFTL